MKPKYWWNFPSELEAWRSLNPSGVELQIKSATAGIQDGHTITRLEITLVNGTNRSIEKYDVEVRLPSGLLKHWSSTYPAEVRCNIPGFRCFRFDQNGRGALRPRDRMQFPIIFDYCTICALPEHEDKSIGAILVFEMKVSATAWVDENEYAVEKTIEQLAMER